MYKRILVTEIYGGAKVTFSAKAEKQLKQFKQNGWDHYPICMAKTQYSFSDDATQLFYLLMAVLNHINA